jgi:hypothetical protein
MLVAWFLKPPLSTRPESDPSQSPRKSFVVKAGLMMISGPSAKLTAAPVQFPAAQINADR